MGLRERFEAWATLHGLPTLCLTDGKYIVPDTWTAWLAWQAATKVEQERILSLLPGGDICDPQAIADAIRGER